MGFFRPEAMEKLTRFREAGAGLGLTALGAFWFLTSLGVIKWLGALIALLGLALLRTGIRSARIPRRHDGPGVVQVDEKQITYLAPFGGGFASLDLLQEVRLETDRSGATIWRLNSLGESLIIPTNAEGGEALFDALTQLPGAKIDTAIHAVKTGTAEPLLIWRKEPRALH
ncbi:MAG: hypothetical protein CR993_05415 [Rhodobacterales bacterium]|nr:MAG: hypothetical protein CR993_05415 [Rhodobacterales bacterium]